MKKRFALLLSLLMLCLTCFGATAESITPGTYTGSGDGFAGGTSGNAAAGLRGDRSCQPAGRY